MVDCTRLCFFVGFSYGFSSVFVWAVGCMSICRCVRFHLELFGTGVRLRRLLLGVTVHEFMLISICQYLCHIMKVSWSHSFIGVNGFIVSCVSWCQWFHGIIGFAVSMVSWCKVSWCQWFHGFIGFVVSMVSWFHVFRGVNGFKVS